MPPPCTPATAVFRQSSDRAVSPLKPPLDVSVASPPTSASAPLRRTESKASARRTDARLRGVISMAAERSDCVERRLLPGEVVFRAGETPHDFFLVESGSVQLAYPTQDGRLLPSRTVERGDIFGASLLGGDGARRETATATEPTVLKAIPYHRFESIMRRDSYVATAVKSIVASSSGEPGAKGGEPGVKAVVAAAPADARATQR